MKQTLIKKKRERERERERERGRVTCFADTGWEAGFLDIIHRKSDVRKKGKTRGWELMLSHSFKTGITSGYIKGTPSSDVVDAIAMLHSCTAEIGHPMLLPVIVLSRDLSPKNDQKQREARDWLRRLEKAVSLRDEVDEAEMDPANSDNLLFEVDGLSRDLVECHGHVLWKRPQAYAALCKEMHSAMTQFKSRWTDLSVDEDRMSAAEKEERRVVEHLHESLLSRIDFYVVKLKGLENYIHTTLERLKVQREAVIPPLPFPHLNRPLKGGWAEKKKREYRHNHFPPPSSTTSSPSARRG
jgi:hypothetical protein